MEEYFPICRFCECPAVDGFIPVSSVDLDKLSMWSLIHMGEELDELDVEHDALCNFCVWDARFLAENCSEAEDVASFGDLSWWLKEEEEEQKHQLLNYNNYSEVRNCWVTLDQLPVKVEEEVPVNDPKILMDEMTVNSLNTENLPVPQSTDDIIPEGKEEEVFKCNFYKQCSSIFKTQVEREIHLEEVHETRNTSRFDCNFCSAKFNTQRSLKGHIIEKHQNSAIECTFPNCRLFFKSQTEMSLHIKEKHKKSQCPFCSVSFLYTSCLHNHILKHHSVEKFKCTKCPSESFESKSKLDSHVRQHNFKMKCPHCSQKLSNDESAIKMHFTPRKCDVCTKILSCSNLLNKHIARCKPISKEAIMLEFQCKKEEPKLETLKEPKEQVFHRFEDKSKLSKKCLRVGKIFKSSLKNLKCDHCGKTLSKRYTMRNHLFTLHKIGNAKFECRVCKKQFNDKHRFSRHILSHKNTVAVHQKF